jgi:hypothetical protein
MKDGCSSIEVEPDLLPLVERARDAERMFERTMPDFNRDWPMPAPIPSARSRATQSSSIAV